MSASGISSAFYESFDAERYSVHFSDGTIDQLTSEQFVLSDDGQTVIERINKVNPTLLYPPLLKNKDLKSKQKNYVRSQKISVEKTAIGINTALTGMDQVDDYGLRVEDKEISLNVPDAVKIVGVYESLNSSSYTR